MSESPEARAWARMGRYIREAVEKMSIRETREFLEDFDKVRGEEPLTELEARVFIGSKVILRCKKQVEIAS